jgi:hypothetical protein
LEHAIDGRIARQSLAASQLETSAALLGLARSRLDRVDADQLSVDAAVRVLAASARLARDAIALDPPTLPAADAIVELVFEAALRHVSEDRQAAFLADLEDAASAASHLRS